MVAHDHVSQRVSDSSVVVKRHDSKEKFGHTQEEIDEALCRAASEGHFLWDSKSARSLGTLTGEPDLHEGEVAQIEVHGGVELVVCHRDGGGDQVAQEGAQVKHEEEDDLFASCGGSLSR
ncbi:unnamed protein product [Caretta caretta]